MNFKDGIPCWFNISKMDLQVGEGRYFTLSCPVLHFFINALLCAVSIAMEDKGFASPNNVITA